MKKVKINFNLTSTALLHSQVNALCTQLEHPFLSRKKARVLSRTLDQVFIRLFNMNTEDLPIFEKLAFEEIENKIISLYRKMEDAWVQREISKIQKETISLKEALRLGVVTPEAIAALKQHIEAFSQDHRACLADRQVIADASRTVEMATTPSSLPPKQPTIHLIDDQLEEGQFEEILEIAHAFYDGKLTEAKRAYNQLPSNHKKQIQEHVSFLGGVLFVNYWETLKALCATANEIVGNGELYPSRDLIEDLFTELNKISAQSSDETLSLGA